MKITNENDEIFGVVCGEQRGENVVVIGNYVQLTFHSDSEVQKKGFELSFTAVPKSGEYIQGDTLQWIRAKYSASMHLLQNNK